MTVRPYEETQRPAEPKKTPAKKAPAKKQAKTDDMSVTTLS